MEGYQYTKNLGFKAVRVIVKVQCILLYKCANLIRWFCVNVVSDDVGTGYAIYPSKVSGTAFKSGPIKSEQILLLQEHKCVSRDLPLQHRKYLARQVHNFSDFCFSIVSLFTL